ncbi:MAG: TlpA disulfide reductase family protein [Mycobacteriaceae bacterium]
MSSAVRWNLLGVAVVIALIFALWPRSAPAPDEPGPSPVATQGELAAAAAEAALAPCPAAGAPRAAGPLGGLTLSCLGEGPTVNLATALGGKPAVLSLWAWWCGPCAKELPVVQEFAQRAGSAVTVLTVHSDPNALKALQALRDIGVHLPAVQDPQQRVAALTGAPAAYPVTVLLRADGTVAQVRAVAYSDPQALAADVDQWLGVRV